MKPFFSLYRFCSSVNINNKVVLNKSIHSKMIMGFISVPNIDEAKKHAAELVSADLVACAKLLPGLTSFYKWEGKVNEEQEVYIIVKSMKEKVTDIEAYLKKNHSYEVHEFIYSEVQSASKDYYNWVVENLLKNKNQDI
mmetsp:Transcript_6391/g.6652  ORF Transcript_6391/g.6652 Transcript_6391/m.6652 type:complete len:139 (+) Transcript_6391:54-470(+)